MKKHRSSKMLDKAIAASRDYWDYLKTISILSLFLLGYLVVGVIGYNILEGWEIRDSLYFISVSLMAVGYGEMYPTSAKSRIFTMCYW